MARWTFPKGSAGRNPERAKLLVGDERRVSCSVVARKGFGEARFPPEERFAVPEVRGDPLDAGTKVPKFGGSGGMDGPKGSYGGVPWSRGAKANLCQSASGRDAEMRTVREKPSTQSRLYRDGGVADLPGGESQPYRRCFKKRRRKPHDLGPPAAGSRENGYPADTRRRGSIPEGAARFGNEADPSTPRQRAEAEVNTGNGVDQCPPGQFRFAPGSRPIDPQGSWTQYVTGSPPPFGEAGDTGTGSGNTGGRPSG